MQAQAGSDGCARMQDVKDAIEVGAANHPSEGNTRTEGHVPPLPVHTLSPWPSTQAGTKGSIVSAATKYASGQSTNQSSHSIVQQTEADINPSCDDAEVEGADEAKVLQA